MGGSKSSRRITRRLASMAATVGLVAGLLAVTVSTSALAAGPLGCVVTNATRGISYNGATASGFQAAIDGAGVGDALTVTGPCARALGGGYRAGRWVTSATLGGALSGNPGALGGGYRAGHWATSATLGGALSGNPGALGGGYRAGHWVP